MFLTNIPIIYWPKFLSLSLVKAKRRILLKNIVNLNDMICYNKEVVV